MKRLFSPPAVMILATIVAMPSAGRAGSESVIYSFTGSDGASPAAGLYASGRVIFGTASEGGAVDGGTAFSIERHSHRIHLLHQFGRHQDGANPAAALSEYAAPNGQFGFCGTTSAGGSAGFGTIFALVGSEQVLYSFTGGADGSNPLAPLLGFEGGTYYGTTSMGGTNNKGTVFVYSVANGKTTLHSFGAKKDGATPTSGLIEAPNGLLFGTTEYGGNGNGTVYQINQSGSESVFYAFIGGSDGSNPTGGLLALGLGNDVNLYGMTTAGGSGGDGTVFGITISGEERIVHNFSGPDGSFPVGDLIQYKRDLYGVTKTGGAAGAGTVFKISPNGKEEVVYSFTGGADGGEPEGGLVEDHGSLFGTASSGGTNGKGVIFEIAP